MKHSPSLAHYACHRLIDEQGKLYASSVVTIDKNTRFVVKFTPFDHTESPFTHWVGGTIILGQAPFTSPLLPGDSISHYIERMSTTSLPHGTHLVAWYTPLTDLNTQLSSSLVRIEENFQ